MKPGNNIEESVRRLRCTSSAETDERIVGDSLAALRESVQLKRPAAIKRMLAVVAAAVIIVAVFVVVGIFTVSPRKQPQGLTQEQVPSSGTAVEAVKKAERNLGAKAESKAAVERFEAERKELERLLAANDVNGIVKMLAEKPLSSRLAAAVYLAGIGNRRAFETLERLSVVFGGGDPNNLFSVAAAEVRSRIGQEKEKEKPGLARVDKSAGRVQAKDEKRYIRGWLTDADGKAVRGEIQLGGLKVKTKADGAFTVLEPNYTESGLVFGRAFDANGTLGCFFTWGKDDDTNDAEIIVGPLAIVKGYVVDEDTNAVSDFELKISVFAKDDSGYQIGIGEEPWRSRIEPNGSFEVNSIPAGVPLQLAIERPGFDKVLIKLADLGGGKTLDVGQVGLKPLPDFNEGGKSPTLQSYGDGAWNCFLAGFVVDENNEPLAGTRISSTAGGKRFEAATDGSGWYEIRGLPNDVRMEVNIYFDGYGDNLFSYTCSEPNGRLDIQIFPPAYRWYDKPAPGLFVRKWLNTEPITLEALKGNVVLLCIGVQFPGHVPLVKELNEIYSKFRGKPFSLIAIHKDPNACGITEDAIKPFVDGSNIEFAFGIDEEMGVVEGMMPASEELSQKGRIAVSHRGLRKEGAMYSLYEVKADPGYYLIDKNGLLRASPMPDALEKWIDRLLEE
jgi:hypothetical protein